MYMMAIVNTAIWCICSPGGSVSKESTCNAGDARDVALIPGLARSPGKGNGYPLQYSCLGNPMDRGAWCATAHGVPRVGHDLATKPATKQESKSYKFSSEQQKNMLFSFLGIYMG